MYKIISKKRLNELITMMEVEAPLVARKAKAGQFIIFRVDEFGERIPLTIADYDAVRGTVTIIFQAVGRSTKLLAEKDAGDSILDFVGPLGRPTELEGYKNACVVGGGVGCAIAYPSSKALHGMKTHVDMIAGFRTRDYVFLEDEMREASDRLIITTDDGSYGEKGFVTDILRKQIENGAGYDLVVTIGPLMMMKRICELTREFGIKTIVSLDPIMIDGTGMCGGCRVTVGGEVKFACVDGPDFDGHQVDFDELIRRKSVYRNQEAADGDHTCRIGLDAPVKRNMSPVKVPVPEQDPLERITNFSEVTLGYTPKMAVEEAMRCLNCKNRPCVDGCPVRVPIPEFIQKVAAGQFEEAYQVILTNNCLPAVCGRVCPQETQCEAVCVRGNKGEPVAIGRLERFVADYHFANQKGLPAPTLSNGHKVAIIGSGPSGLACAGDLAQLGYDVTIFEAFHKAGGVLVYGIPEFRLPKSIVEKEIEVLKARGVKVLCNTVIGKTLTVDELFEEGYKAVYIGSGAGLPSFMNIEGESLNGVYSANEFLTRANLMKAYDDRYDTPISRSRTVAVIGGGNVAMDAARTARRLGAETVYIVYRRSDKEMPARAEEAHHAKEEGIIFKNLCAPTRIIGNEHGAVCEMEVVEMELGEPDASGRRRPIVKIGSESRLPVDTVIVAIGTSPNPLIRASTSGLETAKSGTIVTDEKTATSRPGVFAGGDAATGAATVILAMGAGKTAAKSIDEYIRSL